MVTEIATRTGSQANRAKNRLDEGLQKLGRIAPSLLLILLCSCSYNLTPTQAQKEQKNFGRFKVAPKEALIYSAAGFVGYGLGKNYVKPKN